MEARLEEQLTHRAIKMIADALKKVDGKFVSYQSTKEDIRELCDKNVKAHVERCFAYELYHQIRCQMDSEDYKNWDGIIEVNAEVPKEIFNSPKATIGKNLYPDMVIHGGQGCTDKNLQLVVCEIKRNVNIHKLCDEDIKNDLIKLAWYIETLQHVGCDVGFKAGCFIMTNATKAELEKSISRIIRNEDVIIEYGRNSFRLEEVARKIMIFSYKLEKSNSDKTDNIPDVDSFPLSDMYAKKKEGITDLNG